MNALKHALSTRAKPRRPAPFRSEPGLPELAITWGFGSITTSQYPPTLDSNPSSGHICSTACVRASKLGPHPRPHRAACTQRTEGRMKRQLMAEQWNEYSRMVLPADAPAIQKSETRRASTPGRKRFSSGSSEDLLPDQSGRKRT